MRTFFLLLGLFVLALSSCVTTRSTIEVMENGKVVHTAVGYSHARNSSDILGEQREFTLKSKSGDKEYTMYPSYTDRLVVNSERVAKTDGKHFKFKVTNLKGEPIDATFVFRDLDGNSYEVSIKASNKPTRITLPYGFAATNLAVVSDGYVTKAFTISKYNPLTIKLKKARRYVK